jgi:hypothetical protein
MYMCDDKGPLSCLTRRQLEQPDKKENHMRAAFESSKYNVAMAGRSHQSLGRRTLIFALAGAWLFLCAGWANATVFLDEHFDTYADQAAFQAVWAPRGGSTTLSTDQSVSPTKSAEGLTTATRNLRTFGEVGFLNASTDKVIFRLNFYDSLGTAAAYRQNVELTDGTAPSVSGQIFGLGLNNDVASTFYMARIQGGDGGAGVNAYFKLDGTGAPTRSTGWHLLEADITDTSVSYYVDTILSKTVDITAVTDRSLDTIRLGSALTSTQVAYFDDIHVERIAVPEPSAATLSFLGGLGLAIGAISRRRKA